MDLFAAYLQPEPYPEVPAKAEFAAGFGYGESKWVVRVFLSPAVTIQA